MRSKATCKECPTLGRRSALTGPTAAALSKASSARLPSHGPAPSSVLRAVCVRQGRSCNLTAPLCQGASSQLARHLRTILNLRGGISAGVVPLRPGGTVLEEPPQTQVRPTAVAQSHRSGSEGSNPVPPALRKSAPVLCASRLSCPGLRDDPRDEREGSAPRGRGGEWCCQKDVVHLSPQPGRPVLARRKLGGNLQIRRGPHH